ncbi:MAG: Cys-Gln thioester bond-forming surface protein, partial [Syntrophothermus sp.]
MKRLLLLTLLVLAGISLYAKTQSIALVTGTDKGVNLHLPAALGSEYVFSGTLKGNVNGTTAYFYCIDLKHHLEYNSQYQDVQSTNSKITYILNNYYPYKPLPYTGSLIVEKEASAIQLAIWSISDNLDISACVPDADGSSIKNRALAIAADAAAHAGSIQPFKTLVINIPAQSFTKGTPVSFTVEAYNEIGAPIPGVTVSLAVNEGNLSKTQVTTGTNGVSEVITLTAGPSFSTIITANGRVIIPGGTQYFNVADPGGKQKLVIAAPVNAQKTVTG